MMPDFGDLRKLIPVIALLVICTSCALFQPQAPPDIYYTIPSVTYLRESPGYASRNVATVYRGEQVKILNQIAGDWCQVQTVQEQQVGWIQRPLLSPVPVPAEKYTVQEQEVPLRESPQKEAVSRQVLHQGDQVRKLDGNQQGWWRVLVEKDESLGWLPGSAVSKAAPEQAAAPPAAGSSASAAPGVNLAAPATAPKYFYVATAELDLHQLPLASSQVVKVLKFNNKVERLAQSNLEWLKVRYPETGAQGWAPIRSLAESPSAAPKVFTTIKKRPLKRPRRVQPSEPETTPPQEVEPEVM